MRFIIFLLIFSTFIFAQEEEQKDSPLVEAAKKTGKLKVEKGMVITNKDLKTKTETKKEKKEIVDKGKEYVYEEYKDSKGRTKEDWQKIMKEANEKIKYWEEMVNKLQAELNRLTNDYYAWDDVAYREGVIKVKMDKVREELEKARENLKKAKDRIPELEEEARKSGALPGWLR